MRNIVLCVLICGLLGGCASRMSNTAYDRADDTQRQRDQEVVTTIAVVAFVAWVIREVVRHPYHHGHYGYYGYYGHH
jgi:uncharacterized protein YceK